MITPVSDYASLGLSLTGVEIKRIKRHGAGRANRLLATPKNYTTVYETFGSTIPSQ